MATLEDIQAALYRVAVLVEDDPSFAPVFERLDSELKEAKARRRREREAQSRANELLFHKLVRDRRAATCSSDAPAP